MWVRYGYLLVPESPDRLPSGLYRGVSQRGVWPHVADKYWSDRASLPSEVADVFGEANGDPNDHLMLCVVRSRGALEVLLKFARSRGGNACTLAIDVVELADSSHCELMEAETVGFEPVARGEWSLLSVLEPGGALGHWVDRTNRFGLLDYPDACEALTGEYIAAMSDSGEPEPIAEDAIVDVLRIGLVCPV